MQHIGTSSPRGGHSRVGAIALALAALVALTGLVLTGCTDKASTTTTGKATSTTPATDSTGKTVVTGLKPPSTVSTVTPSTSAGSTTSTTTKDGTVTVDGKSRADYEKALADLTAKLKSSPKDLNLLQDLAVAQYQLERYTEAAQTWTRMIAINDTPMFHNNLANVLRDSGKRDEAIAEYKKAIAKDAKLTLGYVNLASMFVGEGKKDEALNVLSNGMKNVSGDDLKRLERFRDRITGKGASTTTTT